MIHASGRQIELNAGDHRAIVATVGASLRTYTFADEDVVAAYGADEMAEYAQGQALVPWPNRLRDGCYEFAGRSLQVELSEPERHNAIHGFSRWASWEVAAVTRDRVALGLVIHPRAGYPFALTVEVAYALDADEGLTVTTTARNVGGGPLPYGAGFHPYIRVGTSTVDQAFLELHASSYLATDDRALPTGARVAVEGTPLDFSGARALGDVQLDTTFTDLQRDDQGRAWIRLSTPDRGRAVAVWVDEHHPYVLLFTGDSLPDAAQRRRSLGVEPMTCPPNAFATGEGVHVLKPDEDCTTVWGLHPSVA